MRNVICVFVTKERQNGTYIKMVVDFVSLRVPYSKLNANILAVKISFRAARKKKKNK